MQFRASIIIPTFNRSDSLLTTLNSISGQSFDPKQLEVIVVDDGSTDDTRRVTQSSQPFSLRYHRQTNQGDAAARNNGARLSCGQVLIFVDDDIYLEPEYVAEMVQQQNRCDRSIIVGTQHLWLEEGPRPQSRRPDVNSGETCSILCFVDVCCNNISIKRSDYLSLGGMSDLGFSGSSIWCDVEFAYRAHQEGFSLFRCETAVCWHNDYVAQNLQNSKKRAREAAFRAGKLFDLHPEIRQHLPMFRDKTSIHWREDSTGLIIRKIARPVFSINPVLEAMEWLILELQKRDLAPRFRRLLGRWVIGGHIFQEYRRGVRELAPPNR